MELPPKSCPQCREEYLHTAAMCVHCDVALVDARELGREPTDDLPPPSELHLVRAASAAWVVGLSDRLKEAGISHRVEELTGAEDVRNPRQLPYGVFVREQDQAAATAVDAAYLEHEMPDLPNLPQAEEVASEAAADACPACGEAAPPDTEDCPSCGLFLGTGE